MNENVKVKVPQLFFLRNRGVEPSAEDSRLLERCIYEGLGNQIGFHVYDASPTFDFNLTQSLGEIVRSFRGGRGGFDDDMLWISYLIASLNAPSYVSVPVQDCGTGRPDPGAARLLRRRAGPLGRPGRLVCAGVGFLPRAACR